MNSKSKKEKTEKIKIIENAQKAQESDKYQNAEKSKKLENPEKTKIPDLPKKSQKAENSEKAKSSSINDKNEKNLVREKSAVKMVNRNLKEVNTTKEKINESSKENSLMTHWSKSRRHRRRLRILNDRLIVVNPCEEFDQ